MGLFRQQLPGLELSALRILQTRHVGSRKPNMTAYKAWLVAEGFLRNARRDFYNISRISFIKRGPTLLAPATACDQHFSVYYMRTNDKSSIFSED